MHFYPFVDSFSMFYIYAFMGWILEVIYYGIDEGHFVNRGFLNGPLCPVYGIGFYGVLLILEKIKFNFFLLFFGSMVICTFVEFWAGYILYKLFKLRWWDYRDEKLNLWGFICPKFSLYWGIACSMGVYVIHPSVLWVLHRIPDWAQIAFEGIFSIIMLCDIVATVCAIIGFKKRLLFIGGISGEMKVISDKIGGGIYGGVDTVRTKSGTAREAYTQWRTMYTEHRNEEKELAKKHRDEERTVFAKLKPKPIQIKNPTKAIGKKVGGFVRLVQRSEKRLAKTVYLNIGEPGKTAFVNLSRRLPLPRRKAEDVADEILSEEESLEEREED